MTQGCSRCLFLHAALQYKLYDKEPETIARDIKQLANDGYKVETHYSAGNIGGVLLIAVKEEEKKRVAKKKEAE